MLKILRMTTPLGLSALLLAACSATTAGPTPHGTSVSVDALTVTTHVEGDLLVSHTTSKRNDDALTLTIERSTRRATIEPRYGQAKTVTLETVPEDADAANRYVLEPLSFGNGKADATGAASTGGADGTRPRAVDVPPPACANPCFAACDAQFPGAVQNAACRFGCSNGCIRK